MRGSSDFCVCKSVKTFKLGTSQIGGYQLLHMQIRRIPLLEVGTPFKSVIVFWKSHNISERYYFCTRKHSFEVGLKFSLAAGSKMSCIYLCFYVFQKCPGKCLNWTLLVDRQTNTLMEVCFLFYFFIYVCL